MAVAWTLAFSVSRLGSFYRRLHQFQRWLNRLVAALFILVGLYYAYLFYI